MLYKRVTDRRLNLKQKWEQNPRGKVVEKADSVKSSDKSGSGRRPELLVWLYLFQSCSFIHLVRLAAAAAALKITR
jgi:hypothetical protein